MPEDGRTDTELLAAIRGGEDSALQTLLERHADRIFGFGMRVCRDSQDAEEILQDTMLAVTRHAAGFRGDSSFSSWLFSIARNACARRRRKRSGEPAVFETLEHAGEPQSEMPLDEAIDLRRRHARLEQGIAELAEPARQVLVLRDIEGLSARETAEVMGLSVAATKTRLHRARAELRRRLQPPDATADPGCPDVVLALSRSVEGDLGAADCERFESHVDSCAVCSERCEGLRRVLTLCATAPPTPVPDAVRDGVLRAVAAVATPSQKR